MTTTQGVRREVSAEWLEGIRHVCVDKDGTLIDVHRYWSHTSRLRARQLVERFGLPPAFMGHLLDVMGVDVQTGTVRPRGPVGYAPRLVVIEAVCQDLVARSVVVTAEEVAEVFRAVDQHQQATGDYHLEVLPGVVAFLDAARQRDIVLSVYTSDRQDHGLRILEMVGLAPYVAEVVGGGCVTKPKPDPEGFLVACKRVGVPPAASAYIGDTVEDLRMGLAGGANKVIGVGTGLTTPEELSRVTPYVCTRLWDV